MITLIRVAAAGAVIAAAGIALVTRSVIKNIKQESAKEIAQIEADSAAEVEKIRQQGAALRAAIPEVDWEQRFHDTIMNSADVPVWMKLSHSVAHRAAAMSRDEKIALLVAADFEVPADVDADDLFHCVRCYLINQDTRKATKCVRQPHLYRTDIHRVLSRRSVA